jgi:Terpene synthase family 2, C-terminal metal binding
MATTSLPSLRYPFPSAMNPHAASTDRQIMIWATHFGLLSPSHESSPGYGWFAARAYPNAPANRLQIAADWMSWLFLLDDQIDETGIGGQPARLAQLHARFLAILDGDTPTRQDIPLAHALADLRTRMAEQASAPWMQRFRYHAVSYFAAMHWEATNRAERRIPDVATYCTRRPFTGAVESCFDLIVLVNQIRLPDSVRDHPAVQQLERMANNVICWSNDIFSAEKEAWHGDTHNLVLLLMNEERCSFQEALNRVATLHDAEVVAFGTQADQLSLHGVPVSADLTQYVAGLRAWMRANFDWSLTAMRYHSDGGRVTQR